MAKRRIFYGIIVLTAVALIIIVMHILSGFPIQIDNSIEQYQSALQTGPDSYRLNIEEIVTIAVNNSTYKEKSQSTICVNNRLLQLNKTYTSSNFTIQIQEICVDGLIYSTINSQKFYAAISKQDAANRYIPFALLDSKRYQSITGTKKRGIITVQFSDPTECETWAVPKNAEFIDAFGSATINQNGQLTVCSYEISYHLNDAAIHKQYTVRYEYPENNEIQIPRTSNYRRLDHINELILLERLRILLTQAKGLSTTMRENIFCGAFGDRYETFCVLSNTASRTSFTASNNSYPNSASKTVIDNSEDSYEIYCRVLSVGIPPLEYIEDVEILNNSECIAISYTTNEAYAKYLTEYICDSLYASASLLTAHTTNITASELHCTIELNNKTFLPQTINTVFCGICTLDDIPYSIEYTFHQTF